MVRAVHRRLWRGGFWLVFLLLSALSCALLYPQGNWVEVMPDQTSVSWAPWRTRLRMPTVAPSPR